MSNLTIGFVAVPALAHGAVSLRICHTDYAVFIGAPVFGENATSSMLIGAGLISAGGPVVFFREQRLSRAARLDAIDYAEHQQNPGRCT